MKPVCAALLILFMWSTWSSAQDQSGSKLKIPVSFRGGIRAGLSTFSSNRDINYYAPFSYNIGAHATVITAGISLPFSLVYSDSRRSFSQPFNRIGISPTYKWIKVHLGHRNVHFSKYTLAGHTFLGAGIELTPGIFRFGFVTGRFNKALKNVQGIENFVGPRFDRKGYAFKIGVGKENHYFDISLLSARDDIESGDINSSEGGRFIPPAENAVLGLKTHHRLFKVFTWDAEIAASGYTENTLADPIEDDYFAKNLVNKILEPRFITTLRFAGETSVGLNLTNFSLQLLYKRIEPEFQSMGAYTFYNDVEDITVNPSFTLLKGKIRLSTSYGIQRNNLNNKRLQDSKRKIGSAHTNITFSKKVSGNFSYSNYRSDIATTNLEWLSDSFDIIQISEQIRGGVYLKTGPLENPGSLSFSVYRQEFARESGFINNFNDQTTQLGSSLYYHKRGKSNKFSWRTGLNYSGTKSDQISSRRISISGGVDKNIRDKFNINGFVSAGQTKEVNRDGFLYAHIRSGLQYHLTQSQRVNFTLSLIHRKNPNYSTATTDIRTQLNYAVSF